MFCPVHSYDYHNVIAISREYADVTSESLLQVAYIGPLSSNKNEKFIQILNGEYTAKKAHKVCFLKSCHSFQFIAISNSAIINNESVNTAQLISYYITSTLCSL